MIAMLTFPSIIFIPTNISDICIQGNRLKEYSNMPAFKKKNLFKEWMKKFIALLMKEKKTKNQWENNESGFLLALYSVYKKLGQFFFPYFTC